MNNKYLLPLLLSTIRDVIAIVRLEWRLRRLLNTPYYRVERRIDAYLDRLPCPTDTTRKENR